MVFTEVHPMHNWTQTERGTPEADGACRYFKVFPILAGIHGMLCHDQGRSGCAREGAMSTETRGLLRMFTPQERGTLIERQRRMQQADAVLSTHELEPCKKHSEKLREHTRGKMRRSWVKYEVWVY